MGHTWKNGSHLKKWVTIGKMSHTWKNGSQVALALLGVKDDSSTALLQLKYVIYIVMAAAVCSCYTAI